MAGIKINRNAINAGSDISAEDLHRTSTLHDLRPQELIGQSSQLFPWDKSYVSNLKQVKSSQTRQFYEYQNEVIRSLQLVDSVLDSGLHATLIQEYSDDIGQETPQQRQAIPRVLTNKDRVNGNRNRSDSGSPSDDPEQTAGLNSLGGVLASAPELDSSSHIVQFWINLNLLVNLLLLIGKIAVYWMTQSLSIGASLVDSLLDLLSTIIIFFSASFAGHHDGHSKELYPAGRFRLEPIGILVFSVTIVISFIKVAEDSLTRLISGNGLEIVNIGVPSLVVMILTLLIKGVIWQLCKNVKNSSVQALSQDALTDTYFNFFSIVFPVLSQCFKQAELDPLGALLLSLYVVWSWAQIAMEHIDNLIGAACSPLERQQLLYMCIRFSERIKYITALNAYHAGDRLMVEVDVLLDPRLTMRDAHDLAEALQYALETMPIVERAFVHIDYRRGNFTGHVV